MSKQNTAAAKAAPKAGLRLDPKFIGKLAGTLLGICAVVALLLAVVDNVTRPIIDQMQAEKTARAMAQVLAADEYTPVELDMPNVNAVYEAFAGDKQMGYVADVVTSGFGGAINMVVGIDMNGVVTGVAVTQNKETANVGTKVVGDQSVLDRFKGLSGEITVNSGENRFDAVTGATVSSKAVAAGVNTALEAVAGYKAQ